MKSILKFLLLVFYKIDVSYLERDCKDRNIWIQVKNKEIDREYNKNQLLEQRLFTTCESNKKIYANYDNAKKEAQEWKDRYCACFTALELHLEKEHTT